MTQDVTITAKKLRTELKTTFKNCKFSVNCRKYSMGQSIDINWENGVSTTVVEAIIDSVEAEYNKKGIKIRNERSTFIFTHRKVSEDNREAVKTSIIEELIFNPIDGLVEWDFERMINNRLSSTTFF